MSYSKNDNLNEKLEDIEGLKWLPWVGSNYFTVPKERRVLIVGESHYHDTTKKSIEKHESPFFTIEVIKEMAVKKCYYKTKLFPNFHRTIFGHDHFDGSDFWNLVSFYNFVQRPMNTNKGRPNHKDFYDGWQSFFKVIEVLKPSSCLFIGTSASNSLKQFLYDKNILLKYLNHDSKINRTYPRRAEIVSNDDQEVQLFFIRHTSQFFSWCKWKDYLEKAMPNEVEWL